MAAGQRFLRVGAKCRSPRQLGQANGGREDSNSEQREEPSLCQRHAHPRRLRPAERQQADECDGTVADEVESVGFQSLAFCDEPTDRFEDAESKIQDHNNPEHVAVSGIMRSSRGIGMTAAFIRLFYRPHRAPYLVMYASEWGANASFAARINCC